LEHCEKEIKIAVARPAVLKTRLRSLGAALVRRRHFEDNYILDFADGRIRRERCLLRLRWSGARAILTFKGPSRIRGGIKERRELETRISDGQLLLKIFRSLGLQCGFQYQKYRSLYRRNGTLITLDETPIGFYAELEGKPASIHRTAKLLGYTEREYITATYHDIFRSYLKRNRIYRRDMLFDIKSRQRGYLPMDIFHRCDHLDP
jgi:adenylate cyclase class 2